MCTLLHVHCMVGYLCVIYNIDIWDNAQPNRSTDLLFCCLPLFCIIFMNRIYMYASTDSHPHCYLSVVCLSVCLLHPPNFANICALFSLPLHSVCLLLVARLCIGQFFGQLYVSRYHRYLYNMSHEYTHCYCVWQVSRSHQQTGALKPAISFSGFLFFYQIMHV